jgi:CheY-like chemotaxis protein
MVVEGEDEMLTPGPYVKISFQDQGVGIPKDYQEKIVTPYFTTKQTGSGLGLATVYSIVRKHGGHIRVSSSPGRGSLFTIYLPAVESENAFESPDESMPVTSESKFSGGWRVLVMDDEEVIREVAKEMLEVLGCKAEAVDDGRKALECYREFLTAGRSFDLVIMDLTIPGGMGGEEAVQEILRIDPHARVVVSSGYSEDSVVANFRDYGFVGRISKPYNLDELRTLLKLLL